VSAALLARIGLDGAHPFAREELVGQSACDGGFFTSSFSRIHAP
jgi:hypothetical protein